MLRSLRAKLVLIYLAPVSLAIALLGLYLVYAFEDYHLDRIHQDLAADAELVSRLVARDLPRGPDALASLMQDLGSSSLGARVLVFDWNGRLLATSAPEEADKGSRAPEPGVERALRGETTMRRESSPTRPQEMMYAAVPVRVEGQVVGVVRLSYDLSHLESILQKLRALVATAAILAALLSVGIGLVLGETISRPVRRLAQAARAVAAGQLNQRVEVRSQDELRLMADSFNHMAARLLALEEARRSFLADVAHELRSPVGAVRAAVEALLGGAQEDPVMRVRLLRGIEGALSRLGRVTDDLVQLARYETGQMELSFASVSVPHLVREAAARFEAEPAGQEIRLAVEVPEEMSQVQGDEDRLVQVLNNLVSNAIRFTPADGTISLRAGEGPDHVWVSVTDTGVGIPAEDLPHVFDRFYRRDYRPGKRGMGLGLAIVRHIVEAHGGTVDALSDMGKGSVFTFTLPKK